MKSQSLRAGRIQQWIRLVFGCALIAGVLVPMLARSASFTASLDRNVIAVGDAVKLTLSFKGSGTIQLSPMPNIPGLVISGPRNEKSDIIVNGQRSTILRSIYYLRPTQTNVFTVPALTARIEGKDYLSQPLQLRAVKATGPAGAGQALALLRLMVPREQLYVGENVVVELQLLVSRTASNVSDFDMPSIAGEGWMAGQPMQGQKRQVQMGNQVLNLFPIRIPLTPLTSGTLTLGPIKSSVVVHLPSQQRRNDPFSGFGFGMFGRTEPRRVPLSLPAYRIEVLPLPAENVPEDFTGAVGQFTMNVTAGPTNVSVGDPVTLKVQISGRGNLSAVALAEDLVHGDFKTYEPETRLDTTDEFGFEGMQTIEQIVIPENTEVRELPAISFSFFDPETARYQTLTHPETPLVVRPVGSTPMPVVAATDGMPSAPASRQDIVHIKQRLGTPGTFAPVTSLSAQFYVWNAVPLIAWLGAIGWRKRQESLARNPRLRRQQEVRRLVTQGLEDLQRFATEGHADEFFQTTFRLMQEQIGACLDLPASGITEAVVDEKLRPLTVSDTTLLSLHDLFRACDAARYAPTRDPQELTESIVRLETALQELKEVRQ